MRYWLNLLKFLLALGVVALLVIVGFIAILTVRYTRQTLYPDRSTDQTGYSLDTPYFYEIVEFVTSDHLTIRGWYFPSKNGAVVILGSGYGAREPQLLPEANLLVEHGYGVLLFSWRGSGDSDGDMVTIGDREQRDLKAALDWVSARPDVDPNRIGAIGFSMGAVVVAETADDDPRLQAVVIEAAFPSLEEMAHYQAKLFGPLTKNVAEWALRDAGVNLDNVRAIDALCRISPRPVFIIYGSEDDVVPPKTADRMEQAACDPYEFWIMEGIGHGDYMSVDGYAERILAFFDRAL